MTHQASHGARSRRPVYTGNRRVPGLYERDRADGTTVYEVALRLGGRVRRHTLDACTKTDAIAELRALQVDYERGQQQRSPSAALTVADVVPDWLAALDARVGHRDPRRRFSARTVDLYRQRARDYIVPELGHRTLSDLTAVDVRRLIDRLPARLAPATVTAIVNEVSALCRYAVKHGLMERNVVRDLDRDDRPGSARQTEPRYLTRAEVERLLAHTSETFRPIAATCAYAGLRISEALGLRWRDVDFEADTITVNGQLGTGGARVPTKTPASNATVPLLPALKRELLAHRSRQASRDLRFVHADALMLTTSRGTPQFRRNALRAVYKAGDAAGLNGDGREPVGLHDLRHSFVALAFDAEVPLPQTSALARHANARVTAQVYAGVIEGGRERAAAKLVGTGFGA